MTTPFHDPNKPTHNHAFTNDGRTLKVCMAATDKDDHVGHSHTLEEYKELHAQQWASLKRGD